MEKVRFTHAQRTAETMAAFLMLFLWGYLLLNWSRIPDQLPSHYNAQGSIDAFDDKGILLTVAIVCTFLYTAMTAISLFPKLWNIPVKVTEDNYKGVYRAARSLLCFLKLILTALFTYMIVCIANTSPLGAWLMPAALILIFGTIITSLVVIIKRGKAKGKEC